MGGEVLSRANRLALGPRVPALRHRRHIVLAVAGGIFLVAFNIAVYLAPIDYGAFTSFAYVGVFVVTFFANALIAIPIPYIPIVAHIGATAGMPWLVVVLGALASVLGESVAFLAGRAEEGLVSEHPIFDVAVLAAGAVGVRYRVFFVAVFAARLIRLAVIVWLGTMLGLISAQP